MDIPEIKKLEKELKRIDKYPEMTDKAIEELWNNEKYNREGLKAIAIKLLIKAFTNQPLIKP